MARTHRADPWTEARAATERRQQHRRERVKALSAEGLTVPEIAARTGWSERSIQRYRKAAGISAARPEVLVHDELVRAAELLDQGCSYREVAQTLGRGETTIAAHFPGRGWDLAQIVEHSVFNRNMRKLAKENGVNL